MSHDTVLKVDEAESNQRPIIGSATPSAPGSPASVTSDPLKGARQAIRSQAAAREYVERQLVHAEATIEDLRTKLRHARQENAGAAETARAATAAKVAAQRAAMASEAALATEKSARERAERAFREAQATINLLQSKAASAALELEAAKAQLASEREARRAADEARRELKTVREHVAPGTPDEAIVPPIKRPVGRPRKTPLPQPVEVVAKPAGKPPAPIKAVSGKAEKAKVKIRPQPPAVEQEPVQWWVEGWNRRRK
jgi:hypothetical protein